MVTVFNYTVVTLLTTIAFVAGDMAKGFRIFVMLVDDPDLVSSTHMVACNHR